MVHKKGAPLDNCFGFVDGTVRPISRPECNQRIVYNGHERIHAIKFQSIVTPDGMIANMFGPVDRYFKMFAFQSLCLRICVCMVLYLTINKLFILRVWQQQMQLYLRRTY